MFPEKKSGLIVKYLLICGLLVSVFYTRFFGLNWDQNSHLHPDERFLTMVTEAMVWPSSLSEYFNLEKSKLNPTNIGYDFYVYGTWPVILTKFVAEKVQMADYTHIVLVGRALSATADFLTFILVVLITAKLLPIKQRFVGSLAAGLVYGLMVMAIQQAHFFTTDSFLVLSLAACFYALLFKPTPMSASLTGIFFGLAVAAKISGVLFAPIIGLMILLNWLKTKNSLVKTLVFGVILTITFGLTLRSAYPTLFEGQGFIPTGISQHLLASWKSLKSYEGVNTGFPPGLQWIPVMDTPYLVNQFLIWGMGLPLSLLLGFLLISSSPKKIHLSWHHPILVMMIWIVGLLTYQSFQFAKTLRYVYPIVPFVAVLIGFYLQNFLQFKIWKKAIVGILILTAIWWANGFFQIYKTLHTRIAASEWIYANVPNGSTITYEYWDDGLPITLPNDSALNHNYKVVELPLYDPDSLSKWVTMSQKIASADYIFLSSNRLWRSISALPERYPSTTRYYQKLFDGRLGFTYLAQFTNYPCLVKGNSSNILPSLSPRILEFTSTPNCVLAIGNDGAEEAFTVYDHPTVIIFKNTGKYSSDKLLRLVRGMSN